MGYLSIDSLWLFKKNKSVIGAQLSVPTGPVVVDMDNIDIDNIDKDNIDMDKIDKDNIGQISDYIKAGLR